MGHAHTVRQKSRIRSVGSASGFTLIELMIVLVIVAVLLGVALPAYQDSVLRSSRAAGKGVLLDVAARQEQYFINNKTYSDTLDKLGYAVDGSDSFYVDRQTEKSDTAAGAVYQISIVLLSTINFTTTASPVNRQTKDGRCNAFTLSSEGVKTVNGSGTAAECW